MVLGGIGRCWVVLGGVGKYWMVLGGTGWYWVVLVILGGSGSVCGSAWFWLLSWNLAWLVS